jgi:hypothetical protein
MDSLFANRDLWFKIDVSVVPCQSAKLIVQH